MNFLLRNTLKKISTKTIETSFIQSQMKYEYFQNILYKMNKDFEIKMDKKECDDSNRNNKIKESKEL